MKKIVLLFVSVLFVQFLVAQPTLTYDTHSLLPGENNPMTLCKYVDPGIAGSNITWDFSNIQSVTEFTGHINMVNSNYDFASANVELEEFGTSFFFTSGENAINQVGYVSKDKRTVVHYYQPFQKMVYPFSYGEIKNCAFSGDYTFDGKSLGDVYGTGTIEGDAWGTIKLPGNAVYDNTLRVKSVKSYTLSYSGQSPQEVEIVTYRWYNSYHRYPLLVLTKYTTTNGKNVATNYQAAYNNNAVANKSAVDGIPVSNAINLYPNPAETELNISLTASKGQTARIIIYDLSGKNVLVTTEKDIAEGENQISLSSEIADLKPATYLLKVIFDQKEVSKEFILLK